MQEHLPLGIGKHQPLMASRESSQVAEQGTQVGVDDHHSHPPSRRGEEGCGRPQGGPVGHLDPALFLVQVDGREVAFPGPERHGGQEIITIAFRLQVGTVHAMHRSGCTVEADHFKARLAATDQAHLAVVLATPDEALQQQGYPVHGGLDRERIGAVLRGQQVGHGIVRRQEGDIVRQGSSKTV